MPGHIASLYDQDFYAWAQQQAALLRAGQIGAADIAHIAEEIESMGRSEKRELINRLAILLTHLLKWQHQPALQGNSWRLTIKEQRLRLKNHLKDNPSLKAILPMALQDAYEIALIDAERETGLAGSSFPPSCPWPIDTILADGYWPDA